MKKRNRSYFEDKLLSNLKATLDNAGACGFRKMPARILIEFKGDTPWKVIIDKIEKVFGLSVAYPVMCVPVSMAKLEMAMVVEAEKLNFASFAVRTKRADKNFPLTSPEVSAQLGAAIKTKTGAKVDLNNPEQTFFVEILKNNIYFSSKRIKGPGGLPVGISGHVLSLLSGGIDSPVASWMMMKRGVKTTFLHFSSKPFTDEASVEKVVDMAHLLSKWQGKTKVAVVPFGELQQKIVTAVPSKYRVILYRRFMLRIASELAMQIRAEALVSGESLGQVASQTLSNMETVESAASLPILRPLIGMDKQEIVDKAVQIGTYDLSIEPHQDCCSFLQPPNPVTRSTPKELENIEKVLDVGEMVKAALDKIEWKEI